MWLQWCIYCCKEIITLKGDDNDDGDDDKKLSFNNTPFRSCISKINTFRDSAEGLDIVMLMYNLFEYSDKYSMTSGRLWNYYRDEINDDANENANSRINNSETITSKSFHYK